jgi:hypothetical protein
MSATNHTVRITMAYKPGLTVFAYAISWTLWISLAVMGEAVVRGEAWPSHVPGLMGPVDTVRTRKAAHFANSGTRTAQLVQNSIHADF